MTPTYKPTEQYLDAEDLDKVHDLVTVGMAATLTGIRWNSDQTATPIEKPTVLELLSALETLRSHLRKKYYAG